MVKIHRESSSSEVSKRFSDEPKWLRRIRHRRESFFFVDYIPQLSKLNHVKALDLFENSISIANLVDFPNLKVIRISNCHYLTKIVIKNAPKLYSCQFSSNNLLSSIEIDKECKITSLDCSYSENLKSIDMDFSNVLYLSLAHTSLERLYYTQKVKYLNITSTRIKSLHDIYKYNDLQMLVASKLRLEHQFDVGALSNLPNLTTIIADYEKIDCKQFNNKTALKKLWIDCVEKKDLPDGFLKNAEKNKISVCYNTFMFLGESFEKPVESGDWHNSHKELFGSFPFPSFAKQIEPQQMEYLQPLADISDNLIGCLTGFAMADSLTWSPVKYSKQLSNFLYDHNLDCTWSNIITNRVKSQYPPGSFSTNTYLMLAFIRSFFEEKLSVNQVNLARKIKTYIEEGLPELQIAPYNHIGILTRILKIDEYLVDPKQTAHNFWFQKLARIFKCVDLLCLGVPAALFYFWNEDFVVETSKKFIEIISPDPYALFFGCLISLLIARAFQFNCGMIRKHDFKETVEKCFEYFRDYSGELVRELNNILYVKEENLVSKTQMNDPTNSSISFLFMCIREKRPLKTSIHQAVRLGFDGNPISCILGAYIGALDGMNSLYKAIHGYFKYFLYARIIYNDAEVIVDSYTNMDGPKKSILSQ